jgi:hypothetical protein
MTLAFFLKKKERHIPLVPTTATIFFLIQHNRTKSMEDEEDEEY